MISTARSRLEEDVAALDIVRFARAGLLLTGDRTRAWDDEGGDRPLRVIPLGDVVEIRVSGRTLGEVALSWSDCNYGGRRPWWVCPRCESRRRKLYLLGGALRCRVCADIRYGSKLERKVARGLRRAREIRRRLGGRPGLVEPFPQRPSRMRWSTYAALRAEATDAEAAFLRSVAERTHRLRDRADNLVARAQSPPVPRRIRSTTGTPTS